MCKLRRVLYQPRRTRRRHIVVRHVPEAIFRIWGGAAAAGSCCCCCWRFWRRPKTFILFTGCNTSGGVVTIFFRYIKARSWAACRAHFPCKPAVFSLLLFMFVCCCSLPIIYSTALQGMRGCNHSFSVDLRSASGWGDELLLRGAPLIACR